MARWGVALLVSLLALMLPACGRDADTADVGETASTRLLLPDLIVDPPGDLSITRRGVAREREIRFATTTVNVGSGPFELQADHFAPLVYTEVVQHIATEAGPSNESVAGVILFNDLHDHFHFEDYVQLDVLDLTAAGEPGAVVATTGKISFCLFDMRHRGQLLRASPEEAHYSGCRAQRQGISVGWADTYGPHLPGQRVSIDHLPDGRYLLRLSVDPEDRIVEEDEGNNTAEVLVEIEGTELVIVAL